MSVSVWAKRLFITLSIIVIISVAYVVVRKVIISSKPTYRVTPAWHFMCITSVDGKCGRNMSGNLMKNGTIIEPGLTSRSDLQRYLLAPIKTPSRFTTVKLKGPVTLEPPNVMEVCEEVNDGLKVQVLGRGITIKAMGLVVRHNGRLRLEGCQLEVEFIIVESGGVLEITGSTTSPASVCFRTPDYGMGPCGEVASQYGANVYFPGSRKEDYTFAGTPVGMNMFGPKCLAVGFAGQVKVHTTDSIPKLDYTGAWSCSKYSQPSDQFPSIPVRGDDKEALPWKSSYQCMFGCLDAQRDKRTLVVDFGPGATSKMVKHWQAGSKVVVCARSTTYSSNNNPVGRVPVYFDWDDATQRSLSAADAIAARNGDDDTGVEVATISSTSFSSGVLVLTLVRDLKYDHGSQEPFSDEGITIDTRPHVGLLSRAVRVWSDTNSTASTARGSGGNVWYASEDAAQALRSVPTLNDPSTWLGAQGTVVCSYDPNCIGNASTLEDCIAPLDASLDENLRPWCDAVCDNERPYEDKKILGSVPYATAKHKGSNSISGAHIMACQGASLELDGVELWRMGVAGNFGSIGRYPVHFHMFGYAQSFQGEEGYCDNGAVRVGCVQNCSIWSTFSRFVVMHGSHEVQVRNNVCFWSLMSGLFTEDGTESRNSIEHNLVACVHNSMPGTSWNPKDERQLFPHVSSDFCFTSAVWLKSNNNRCLRNVLCCSPSPVLGVWSVAQMIRRLRGPSVFCSGDEQLGLPALGINDPFGSGDTKRACWSPKSLIEKGVCRPDGAVLFGVRNDYIPYLSLGENVCYNMAGFWSEFPDTEFAPYSLQQLNIRYEGNNAVFEISGRRTSSADLYGLSRRQPNPNKIYSRIPGDNLRQDQVFDLKSGEVYQRTFVGGVMSAPVYKSENTFLNGYNPVSINDILNKETNNPGLRFFLPKNTQHGCLDGSIARAPYFETRAGEPGLPEPPEDVKNAASGTIMYLGKDEKDSWKLMPKLIYGCLTFNLGPMRGGLNLGAGWAKSSAVILSNCCFLTQGAGTRIGSSQYPDNASTAFFSMLVGDNVSRYEKVFHIYENLITDGGLLIPPNPTTFLGDHTHFFQKAKFVASEYVPGNNAEVAACIWSGGEIAKRAAALLLKDGLILNQAQHSVILTVNGTDTYEKAAGKNIFEKTTRVYTRGSGNRNKPVAKYVCMCTETELRSTDNKGKWWGDLNINAFLGYAHTKKARYIANSWCTALASM